MTITTTATTTDPANQGYNMDTTDQGTDNGIKHTMTIRAAFQSQGKHKQICNIWENTKGLMSVLFNTKTNITLHSVDGKTTVSTLQEWPKTMDLLMQFIKVENKAKSIDAIFTITSNHTFAAIKQNGLMFDHIRKHCIFLNSNDYGKAQMLKHAGYLFFRHPQLTWRHSCIKQLRDIIFSEDGNVMEGSSTLPEDSSVIPDDIPLEIHFKDDIKFKWNNKGKIKSI